jgi:hypothetical protein
MTKNKFMNLVRFILFLFVASLIFSCNDPTAVGANLLEEDRVEVGYTDTFSVSARTIKRDSVRVYSPFSQGQLANFLLGNFNDPILGRSSASINGQLFPTTSSPGFKDEINGIDSVILYLPYNIFGLYGNLLDEEFGIEVYQLDENIRDDQDYYSDFEAMLKPELLGSTLETLNFDSTDFWVYRGTERDTLSLPSLRIPLDVSLAEQFLDWYEADSTFFADDSLFLANFNGIHLRPTTENGGILNFSLLDANAGLYIFYRDTADMDRHSLFTFNTDVTASFLQLEHDYTGSLAEAYISDGNTAGLDSLLFVQGMAGLEVELEFPAMDELKGAIINQAELEFFIREFDSGDTIFSPINLMALSTIAENGSYTVIEEIKLALDRFISVSDAFGGVPVSSSEDAPQRYVMNISTYLQRIIDGDADNKIYLTPFGEVANTASGAYVYKASTGSRVVLYGNSHPDYGINLKVTYTNL